MKKFLSLLFVFGMIFSLVGCGSDNDTSKNDSKKTDKTTYQEKLKDAGFKENVENEAYELNLENGNKVYVFPSDGYINFENNVDDAQIKYMYNDGYADMYGCRLHDDGSTTEDGEGFGECQDETVSIMKQDKAVLDEIMKDANIDYSELTNK